jgi:large repetitive protein
MARRTPVSPSLRYLLVLSLLTTFLVVTPSVAQAATLTVTNTADHGSGSLRQAISAASAGDTIDFAIAGDGPHTILTDGQITIGKDLTITGPGAEVLAVSGIINSRLFEISSGATVTISGLTITGGGATQGGGIYIDGGTLEISNSTLSGNSAKGGGAIYNSDGRLTIAGSTVSGNSATLGGGIYNTGMLTVSSSTLSGNSAGLFGGGIFNNGGTLEISNSTLSSNNARFEGGGIFNTGSLIVASTIVAGNAAGTDPDVSGSVLSDTDNLIGGDAKLGALQDNGGPTQTMLPEADSPAIDAGGTSCPSTDQRGIPRPQGGSCDIGAVEVAALDGSRQLTLLIEDVRAEPVSFLVKPQLLLLLRTADLSLERDLRWQTCATLSAFSLSVRADSRIGLIPSTTASAWRADVDTIRDALGCR